MSPLTTISPSFPFTRNSWVWGSTILITAPGTALPTLKWQFCSLVFTAHTVTVSVKPYPSYNLDEDPYFSSASL